MNEYLKYNFQNYINTNTKKHQVFYFLLILILILLIVFCYVLEIHDVELVKATTICTENNCNVNFYHNGTLKVEYNFVKIKNEKYLIENISFLEPVIDYTNNIIQNVTLDLKEFKGSDKEIVDLKIYKNKEKVIKKIWKIIVER